MLRPVIENNTVAAVLRFPDDFDGDTWDGKRLGPAHDDAIVGATYDGLTYARPSPPPPPPLDNASVNAERDRRIARGVTIRTSTGKVVPVDTRDERDFRNIAGLGQVAMLRSTAGDTTPSGFRGSDDTTYTLTPAEIIDLGLQVAAHVNAHYAAAWAIKDLAGDIPADYAADNRWP